MFLFVSCGFVLEEIYASHCGDLWPDSSMKLSKSDIVRYLWHIRFIGYITRDMKVNVVDLSIRIVEER
jgi:hypothetical protein